MIESIKLTNYSQAEIFKKIILPVFQQYSDCKAFADDGVWITNESSNQ